MHTNPIMTIMQWRPFLNPRWRPKVLKLSETSELILEYIFQPLCQISYFIKMILIIPWICGSNDKILSFGGGHFKFKAFLIQDGGFLKNETRNSSNNKTLL